MGQIFLHDIDWESGEGLIGYHLYKENYRGKGTGTKVLELLLQFCEKENRLSILVIITGEENLPSRRMAKKCGFVCIGAAREDLSNVVYERI